MSSAPAATMTTPEIAPPSSVTMARTSPAPSTAESTRSRRKEKRIPSKLCVRCGGVKPLNEFYANKGWASQSFHDAWCRECAMKYCVDRETLQEYCW